MMSFYLKGTAQIFVRRLAVDIRGAAVIEFALLIGTFTLVMVNGVEAARYYYGRMELENATQAAAQAAWSACDSTKVPAMANCPGLNNAIATALKTTSLASSVTLQASSPTEGYYCTNTAGDLTYVSSYTTRPNDCGSVGSSSDTPGDYISIKAQYTYSPIFNGLSLGSVLPSPVKATVLMRLK